ncbi:MAG: hypothetical protein ACJAVZ_002594 [Afipia broomeae]
MAAPSPPATAPADLLDLRFVQVVVVGNSILRKLIRLDRSAGERLRRERRGTRGCDGGRTCGSDTKRELEKNAAIHGASSDVLPDSRIQQRA